MPPTTNDTRTPPESLATSKTASIPVSEVRFVRDTRVPGHSSIGGLGPEQLDPSSGRDYFTVHYLRADHMFEIVHYPADRKKPPSEPGYVPLEQVWDWRRK